MKMRVFVAAALVLIIASCAKPPVAEIEAAKAAVAKAAQNVDIVTYAPDTLKDAQNKLAQMQTELNAKRYDRTKSLALDAAAAAEKASSDASAYKERIKSDASSLLDSIKKAMTDAEKTVASAKKVRGMKLSFTVIDKGIQDAKAAMAQAVADFGSGNYLQAKSGAADVQAKIADIVKTVSDAVQKTAKKK
jgi:hypothetical protein